MVQSMASTLASAETQSANRFPPQRILICSSVWMVGGLEIHNVNLSRLLVANGADVTFVTRYAVPGSPAIDRLRAVPVRFLTTPFANRTSHLSTAWAMAFWPQQLRGRFDVLYTFDTTWFAIFLARFVKPTGYVLGTHVGTPNLDSDYLHPATRSTLDGFMVESPQQIEAYSSLGITVKAVPQIGQVSAAPERRQRQIDELHVAFMGRLIAAKGIYRLLDMWPALDIRPARLDIYGHGPELERLEQQISDRGLSDCVRLHGEYDAEGLGDIMAHTDLLVFPTDHAEGLPLTLLECMAFGVPFVASNEGAIPTLAENNPDVRVVPLEQAAFKKAIEELSVCIRAGQARGDRLQEWYRTRFGYGQISEQWLQALLAPEQFWGPPTRLSPAPKLPRVLTQRAWKIIAK
jgi:glycosyltransferase involved in cell wall biosynthesis